MRKLHTLGEYSILRNASTDDEDDDDDDDEDDDDDDDEDDPDAGVDVGTACIPSGIATNRATCTFSHKRNKNLDDD